MRANLLLVSGRCFHDEPERLLSSYTQSWNAFQQDREGTYEGVKARFNSKPTAEDLLFLSRSCYGGVIRFRKDGYMSTPCGPHRPVTPESLEHRVTLWRKRTAGAEFFCADFEETMERAGEGDLIYCDPPYFDTQAILYGAQAFTLERLYAAVERAKARGAFVALSIDGKKKSGTKTVEIEPPQGLFENRRSCELRSEYAPQVPNGWANT